MDFLRSHVAEEKTEQEKSKIEQESEGTPGMNLPVMSKGNSDHHMQSESPQSFISIHKFPAKVDVPKIKPVQKSHYLNFGIGQAKMISLENHHPYGRSNSNQAIEKNLDLLAEVEKNVQDESLGRVHRITSLKGGRKPKNEIFPLYNRERQMSVVVGLNAFAKGPSIFGFGKINNNLANTDAKSNEIDSVHVNYSVQINTDD